MKADLTPRTQHAVRRTAYTDGQGRTIVREDGHIVQGRRVADIVRDQPAHMLEDVTSERRIVRGQGPGL